MTSLVFDVLFEAQSADLEAKIAKAKAELEKLNAQKVSPKVDLDIAAEEAKLAQINAKLTELGTKTASPKVDADKLAFEAKAAQVQAKIDELKRQKASVNIDLDIAAFEAKIAALQAELAGHHLQQTVDVNVDSGIANLRRLASEGDSLASKFKSLDLGSGLTSAISAAVIPAIQSIGQLSGALGLIPAIAVGAGTALGTVALGVQGMGAAFTASEKATKAQEAALKADQAAATAHTAAVKAGTAAGTADIAVLKQRVAEGAALVARLQAQKAAGQDVTAQLTAAKTAQAENTAALKTAQAAYSGNTTAAGANATAQQNAASAASKAKSAHEAAAKAADEQAAAMKDLAPAAQQVVSQLIQLKPAFDALRMDVQQSLFVGLGAELKKLSESVLPVVRTGLMQMGTALNHVVTEISSFMQQKSSIASWKDIFANLALTVDKFAGAIKPIMQIFTDLTQVGASMLPGLAQGFATAMQKAADFVSKAKETGQLRQWIQTGIDAVKTLWGIFQDLVQIIAKVTAAPGPGLLDAIKGILDVVLQLITQFPILIPLVEGFVAAWAIAKLVQGITKMATTIKTVLVGAIKLATGEVKIFGDASVAAGAKSEAAASKAGLAWKAAGLAILAVGADALLPQNTPQQEQQGKDHPLTSGYGDANRSELKGIADAIKDPMKALEDLKQELNAFPGQFQNSPFMNFWRTLPITIKTALSGISGVFQTMWQTIQQGATSFASGFMAPINAAISGLKTAWNALPGFFSTLWNTITTGAQSFAAGFVAPFQTAWTAIKAAVSAGISAVQSALSAAWSAIQSAATTAWTAITTAVSTAWTAIQSAVTTGVNAVQSALSAAWSAIQSAATTAWTAVTTAVSTAWTAISGAVQTGVQTVLGYISALPGQITSALGNLGSILTSAGQAAMTGFYNAMVSFYNSTIAPWLQSIAQSIASLKGPANEDYNILTEAGTQIMAGLHDSMQTRWGPIVDWLRSLRGQIGDAVGGTSGGSAPGLPPALADLGVGAASGLSGPLAPYITHPNYDFDAMYKSMFPPPPPAPAPTPTPGGGHHGGHGHHGGLDLDALAEALRGALHDVFSGGIRTDVDYNALTLRLNQVTRSNARR